MNFTQTNKEKAVAHINEVFDDCEYHKAHWVPVVDHLTPFGIHINKHYSHWSSAIKGDNPYKRALLLDLLDETTYWSGITYEEIEKVFNKRYGN